MAYDEGLAERIRSAVGNLDGMRERKMFGGLAFLHHGNVAFGIIGDELMVRVGPDAWPDVVALPHMQLAVRDLTAIVGIEEVTW